MPRAGPLWYRDSEARNQVMLLVLNTVAALWLTQLLWFAVEVVAWDIRQGRP